MTDVHPPARDLLLLAIDHGWSAAYQRRTDACDREHPWLEIVAVRDSEPFRVSMSWHTHRDRQADPGTYRQSGGIVGIGVDARDARSLKEIKSIITGAADA